MTSYWKINVPFHDVTDVSGDVAKQISTYSFTSLSKNRNFLSLIIFSFHQNSTNEEDFSFLKEDTPFLSFKKYSRKFLGEKKSFRFKAHTSFSTCQDVFLSTSRHNKK